MKYLLGLLLLTPGYLSAQNCTNFNDVLGSVSVTINKFFHTPTPISPKNEYILFSTVGGVIPGAYYFGNAQGVAKVFGPSGQFIADSEFVVESVSLDANAFCASMIERAFEYPSKFQLQLTGQGCVRNNEIDRDSIIIEHGLNCSLKKR